MGAGQSTQGAKGPKGDQGPAGPRGPSGKDGKDGTLKIDSSNVDLLKNDKTFISNLEEELRGSLDDLPSVKKLHQSTTIINNVSNELRSSDTFINKVAEKLKSDASFKKDVTGPKGDPGSAANLPNGWTMETDDNYIGFKKDGQWRFKVHKDLEKDTHILHKTLNLNNNWNISNNKDQLLVNKGGDKRAFIGKDNDKTSGFYGKSIHFPNAENIHMGHGWAVGAGSGHAGFRKGGGWRIAVGQNKDTTTHLYSHNIEFNTDGAWRIYTNKDNFNIWTKDDGDRLKIKKKGDVRIKGFGNGSRWARYDGDKNWDWI